MARIARSPGSSAGIRAAVAGLILGSLSPAWGQLATGVAGAPQAAMPQDTNFFGVVWDSLSGDVYAPGRWKPLPFATFFSEGWDEPWAGGPNGQGGDGAPRQG